MVGCMSVGVGFAKAGGAGPGLLAALISRAVHDASNSVDGAVPETPINGAPGMRTPGICGETAYSGLMSQCATKW